MVDDDVARMMADLGLTRRDHVSAPLDTRREPASFRNDRYRQQDVLAAPEARRVTVQKLAGGDTQRASTLSAWNSATTFDRDEVAEQLGNRWSGQGHRAALSERRQYDEAAEANQVRYGEERHLYLQQRNKNQAAHTPSSLGGRGNQAAHGSPSVGGRGYAGNPGRGRVAPNAFATLLSSNQGHPNAPRVEMDIDFHDNERRPTSNRSPNRTRAKSPRAAGTVRYVKGVRIETDSRGKRIVSTPQGTPSQPRAMAGPSTTRPPPVAPAAPAPGPSTTQPRSIAAPASDPLASATTREIVRNCAMYYAVHPGEEANSYHERFPDRVETLHRARAKLVQDLTIFAADPQGVGAKDYLQVRDCGWMLEVAVKAKELAEHGAEGEVDAYLAAHPDHKDFLDAAKAKHAPIAKAATPTSTPRVTVPTVVVVPPSTTSTQPPSPPLAIPAFNSTNPQAEAIAPAINARSSPTTPTETPIKTQRLVSIGDKSSSDSSSEHSPSTVASEPPPRATRGNGNLIASFFNAVGDFLGHTAMSIGISAQVSVNVTSLADTFDPRTVVESLEALAAQMTAMSAASAIGPVGGDSYGLQGVGGGSHGLEGVRLSDDGLWEDDDD